MTPRRRLQPIDYAVMFGGPILFFLIFWIGIRGITGPIPPESPVQRLRNGEIEIGTSMTDVQKKLGRANQLFELPNGGYRMIYTRTVYESVTKSDSLDEAVIDFTPAGRVENIKIDRDAPRTGEASP